MKAIEFLTIWLKDIVLVFIFTSIVELVIPNSNMKKYANMIIGFLVIIVIITPFIKLIHKDYSFTKDLYKNQVEGIVFEYKDNKELSRVQEDQIKGFYINKVKVEIEDLIAKTTNYSIEKINISISEEESDFGKLKAVELILSEIESEEKEENNGIIVEKIKEVTINQDVETTFKHRELSDEKIKKSISENYNLPEENIKILITIKEEGGLGG